MGDETPAPEEFIERTQLVPGPPDSPDNPEAPDAVDKLNDRTQALPPPSTPVLSPEEQDRRLAQELSRRGVPPAEVQRLLALGRAEREPLAAKPIKAIVEPPLIPFDKTFEPKPSITLPEFRESTTQERTEAERKLTSANIARRRGLYKQAEQECRAAIELIPADGAALELYGDVLQGLGRVDDAAFAYQRALDADPKRRGAERKFAELTLQQNRALDMLREERIPRNPTVAIVFSALFPGAGQVYNGQLLKGIVVAAAFAACVYFLGWTPLGFSGSHTQISAPLMVLMALAGAVYIYGVADANVSARRGKRMKSGWEV